jgi:serine/threonine protein kinase
MFVDLMQGLLCYDPMRRLTPEEALLHPFLSKIFPQGPLGSPSRTWTFRDRILATVEYSPAVSVPMGHPAVKNALFHSASSNSLALVKTRASQPRPVAGSDPIAPNKSTFLSLRAFGSGVPFGSLPNPSQSPSPRKSSVGSPLRAPDSESVTKSPPSGGATSISTPNMSERSMFRNSASSGTRPKADVTALPKWQMTNPPSLSNRFGWNRAEFSNSSSARTRTSQSETSSPRQQDDDDSIMMVQEAGQSSEGSANPFRSVQDFVVVAGFGAASARKRKVPPTSASPYTVGRTSTKSRKVSETDSSPPPFDLSGEHG